MSTSKDKIQLILKVEERILLDFESWETKLTQVIMRDLDFENWMPKLKIKKIGEKLRQQKTYRVQNCSSAFFFLLSCFDMMSIANAPSKNENNKKA